eukprot:Skav202947  [mRNA]  locus=scaffold422:471720:476784:+ [translate_table: standard]
MAKLHEFSHFHQGTLRILRLLRALRALQYFRTVWRLVHGLLNSGNAMLSTCLLIVLTLYIGACLGIEMITKDEFLILHEETVMHLSWAGQPTL